MHEERFVVEVSEPVPSAEVAEVAGHIARILHMDVARVRKLLQGRIGPVTKPVLNDKANVIAAAFEEAGVRVIMRRAPATAAATAAGTALETAEGHAPADDAGAPALGGAPSSRDAIHERQPHASADLDDASAASGAAATSVDVASGQDEGTGAAGRPRYVGRTGVYPPSRPTDVSQRSGSGDGGGPKDGGDGAAESTPASSFLSSTRWVPSPHEDLGYTTDDLGASVDDLPDEPLPTRRSDQAGTHGPYSGGRSSDDGPGLRSFLLVGLVVALVLLLVLQAVNRNRQSRVPEGATVAMGLEAYRAGDFDTAGRIWRPLARAGDATAQYMLGYMAQNGLGQPWSNREASEWYRLAADKGLPQAQTELGMLYLRGMGVDRDPMEAAALLRAASASAYGPAQYQYAMLLFQGVGVQRDFPEALHWFELAQRNGIPEAAAYVESLSNVNAASGEASDP